MQLLPNADSWSVNIYQPVPIILVQQSQRCKAVKINSSHQRGGSESVSFPWIRIKNGLDLDPPKTIKTEISSFFKILNLFCLDPEPLKMIRIRHTWFTLFVDQQHYKRQHIICLNNLINTASCGTLNAHK